VKLRHACTALAVLLAACGGSADAPPATPALELAGPPGSGKSFLTPTQDGGAILTWFEPTVEEASALRIAVRQGGTWSEPRTVAEHDRFFVNWADFPSVVETSDGRWVVHWLEKTAPRPYAYHVMLSTSADQGLTWSTPIRAHADTSATEHGFAEMRANAAGGVDMVWLDGNAMGGEHGGPMQLRFGTLLADGTMSPEVVLDDMTCECCQARLIRTASGMVATYRDRSPEEVRDIGVVRFADGAWQAPTLVADDGWVHRACPVNGPALGADGDRVGLAWYTQGDETPRVMFAWSTDGGASFGTPVRLDAGQPIGRPDLLVEEDGSAIVAWLEGTGEREAEWRLVRVHPDGSLGTAVPIYHTAQARNAGFLRMTRAGQELLATVTAVGDTGGMRVLRVPVPPVR
jgi:hypothetical protein